uniref:Uncharacterized protein n=1 Tax=Myoviridae sp. ctkfK18 TaxID=2825165 RepID=A0A8S5VH25_9CAUD|nr:MAG TPA: hypothetical protein [Myoviridae sp. ctkfK18]
MMVYGVILLFTVVLDSNNSMSKLNKKGGFLHEKRCF